MGYFDVKIIFINDLYYDFKNCLYDLFILCKKEYVYVGNVSSFFNINMKKFNYNKIFGDKFNENFDYILYFKKILVFYVYLY